MTKTQKQVEDATRSIGNVISEAAREAGGLGFALLMFDFGPEGTMSYASNASRSHMVAALEELLQKLREAHQ